MRENTLVSRFFLMSCIGLSMLFASCSIQKASEERTDDIRLMTLDPGHFHAALIQKSMFEGVDTNVFVYAPEGNEVKAHLALIERYNSRSEDPTLWNQQVYTGADFLEKMLEEKPGDVVVLAGNNRKKTQYIHKSVENGLHVFSDKPMAITEKDFELLRDAFSLAEQNEVLLYDIMTERYEIHSVLQKELAHNADIFGELEKGTLDNPGIAKSGSHFFYKEVSGAPLIRPVWYYDTQQEGDGLVDITTHMVDLVQWQTFPDVALDYETDVNMIDAKRWPTQITADQFKQSTNAETFPDFLQKDVKDNVLSVYSNGEMNYTLKGVHVKISVEWNFQAPPGSSDTHLSMMRGTKANLVIRQGAEQGYKPALFIEPTNKEFSTEQVKSIEQSFVKLQDKYPGIELEKQGPSFQVIIPATYKVGHEAHFSMVAEKYIKFLKEGNMPAWEVPNMLTKYYTTTQALKKALEN